LLSFLPLCGGANDGEIPVSLATKMGWLPFLGNFVREKAAFWLFAYEIFTLLSFLSQSILEQHQFVWRNAQT
jgi:hypothetical protein